MKISLFTPHPLLFLLILSPCFSSSSYSASNALLSLGFLCYRHFLKPWSQKRYNSSDGEKNTVNYSTVTGQQGKTQGHIQSHIQSPREVPTRDTNIQATTQDIRTGTWIGLATQLSK